MKEKFTTKRFSVQSLALIETLNGILDEYEADGYVLTLRQLYYQCVARGHIENSLQSYKRIVSLVGDARLAGMIDWAMLTDRNREAVIPPSWTDPGQIVRAAANQFRIDKWADQPVHIEVMVEKDALSSILAPVCSELSVTLTANKGYNSLSNMYEAGQRLQGQIIEDKQVLVLYLGDHDPSGIDMSRDVQERLSLFAGEEIVVRRLALNYEQVEVLNLPENPAKPEDSRYATYVKRFGESSWELDAIEPHALARLVTDAVLDERDDELWKSAVKREEGMRNELFEFAQSHQG